MRIFQNGDASWFFNLKVWGLFFIYTLLIGLFIQLVLLPYIIPSIHAGDGLLLGGDWFRFNQLAIELANKIHSQGWSAWELAPGNQPVAGIAAIFYVLISPKPWTVLPLNAALHATAALALYQMLFLLAKNWKISLLATLPFVLFPSALTWTAQMHNDSYAIAGQLLFFFGWVLLSRLETYSSWKSVALATVAIVAGISLVWLVRVFLVQILQIVSVFTAVLLTIQFIVWVSRSRNMWPKAVLAVALVWSLVFIQGYFSTSRRVIRAEQIAERTNMQWETPTGKAEVGEMDFGWLTAFFDRELRALSATRQTNIRVWAHGASNIDVDVEFHSAMDIIRYVPRALQVGFLAPFPSDWFGSGSTARTTMERRIAGVEMSFSYLAFLGLPIALWQFRKHIGLYVLLLFASSMLMLYTLVIINLGTLYRFRYPYFLIFVALGVAGWYIFLEPRLARIRRK